MSVCLQFFDQRAYIKFWLTTTILVCWAFYLNSYLFFFSVMSSNAASFDPVWNVNACRVGDTACPPPARPLPNSRDSVSTTVQLCGADFARRTCFWACVVDQVRPSPRPNRAGRGDLNRPVLRSTMSFASGRCDDWHHSSGPSVGSPRTSVLIRWFA